MIVVEEEHEKMDRAVQALNRVELAGLRALLAQIDEGHCERCAAHHQAVRQRLFATRQRVTRGEDLGLG